MSASERRKNLRFLAAMESCSGLGRGAYLVAIGWTTLAISNDVAVVGQLFLLAMLVLLFTAPFIGTIADRHDRRFLGIAAHLSIALLLGALALSLSLSADQTLSLGYLFAAVAAITALRMLYESTHDGLIRSNTNIKHLQTVLGRFRSLHLFTTAAGTIGCGLLIDRLSPSAGFYFPAACSLGLCLSMLGVKGGNDYLQRNGQASASFLQDLAAGLRLSRSRPALLRMAVLTGVALPIGQLSNAILSSFIRDDLGRGSDVFGIVDSAWPVGGMTAALVLALGLSPRSESRFTVYVFALLVGFSTMAFSQCTSVISLTLVHALMGFSVWMCRIMIDARVLAICEDDTVGRAKATINAAFGFFAMIMCLTPTLVSLPSTSGYFFWWGLVTIVATLMVAYKKHPPK